MRIQLTSVYVEDQERALAFYTRVLGFVVKSDIPLGEHRWLTVVSPEAPDGVELLLEPNQNPAAQAYQAAVFEQGIPLISFAVDDIEAEHARLLRHGVVFTMEPTPLGEVLAAIFDDTCGNLVQIYEAVGSPENN